MSYRRKWIKKYGQIPEGKELHHIIPRHAGGTDDIDNIIAVTPEEHAELHMARYNELGDFRDLCAYHMIGYNFSEAHKISASAGGKIGGTKVFESKVGIFRSEEERKLWASMGGKVGAKVQMENGIGIHGQTPEERKAFARMGGIASPAFKDPKIQSENGKRGGVKNKGFIWINDGTKTLKYTKKQQELQPIDEWLKDNPKFKKGRKLNENSKD